MQRGPTADPRGAPLSVRAAGGGGARPLLCTVALPYRHFHTENPAPFLEPGWEMWPAFWSRKRFSRDYFRMIIN